MTRSSQPNKAKKLLAAMCLAGEQKTKRIGEPSGSDITIALMALDAVGCGHDIPAELERRAVVYCLHSGVRVTEHGAEWFSPDDEPRVSADVIIEGLVTTLEMVSRDPGITAGSRLLIKKAIEPQRIARDRAHALYELDALQKAIDPQRIAVSDEPTDP